MISCLEIEITLCTQLVRLLHGIYDQVFMFDLGMIQVVILHTLTKKVRQNDNVRFVGSRNLCARQKNIESSSHNLQCAHAMPSEKEDKPFL